jgi:hypothetical protein
VAGYTRGFVLENPQDRDKTKEKNDAPESVHAQVVGFVTDRTLAIF